MLNIARCAVVSAVFAATACSTTTDDLERKQSTKSATRTYSENYQEIYRRIFNTASRCRVSDINSIASSKVDAQLYTDLGFGEITLSLVDFGIRNYYWKAKIERDGAGAKLTVHSGNTSNNQRGLNDVLRWADGDQAC